MLYGKILKDYIQEIGDRPSSKDGKEALIYKVFKTEQKQVSPSSDRGSEEGKEEEAGGVGAGKKEGKKREVVGNEFKI